MENDSAFRPGGLCLKITGDSASPPTGVQLGGPAAGDVSVMVWNSSSTNGAFLGYGQDATTAQNNSVLPTSTGRQVLPIPPGSLQTFTMAPNQFYSARTLAGTADLYLLAGNGV